MDIKSSSSTSGGATGKAGQQSSSPQAPITMDTETKGTGADVNNDKFMETDDPMNPDHTPAKKRSADSSPDGKYETWDEESLRVELTHIKKALAEKTGEDLKAEKEELKEKVKKLEEKVENLEADVEAEIRKPEPQRNNALIEYFNNLRNDIRRKEDQIQSKRRKSTKTNKIKSTTKPR